MSALTKENAKYHCRTCLRRLNIENSTVENHCYSEKFDSDEFEPKDVKDFGINITTNNELHYLLLKYAYEQLSMESVYDIPQNVCIDCYDKLQTFDKFYERAVESAEKLKILLSDIKDEVNIEFEYTTKMQQNERIISTSDSDQPLVKDTSLASEVLLDNNKVTALVSIEMDNSIHFETTEPIANNILCTNHSASVKLESFEWNEYIDHISCDTIKIESSEEIPLSTTGAVIKTEFEYMDNDQQDETNISPKDFYQTVDTSIEPQAVSLDNNISATVASNDVYDTVTFGPTAPNETNNLQVYESTRVCENGFDWKEHIEDTSNKTKDTIKLKNNFKNRCDKSYTFVGGLHRHIKEAHGSEERSYSCDYSGCDRVYKSIQSMLKHKRGKHFGKISLEKFVCDQCGSIFSRKFNLIKHCLAKHPKEDEKAEYFECKNCNKNFHSPYTLKNHTLQQDSNDKKHECDVCGQRMAKKFSLIQHMPVHSNNKTPCEQCGVEFVRKNQLQKHIHAVHMKLKPYKCQYCTQCFASKYSWIHHEYMHTGEKPYSCNICGKSFRNMVTLKRHRSPCEEYRSFITMQLRQIESEQK